MKEDLEINKDKVAAIKSFELALIEPRNESGKKIKELINEFVDKLLDSGMDHDSCKAVLEGAESILSCRNMTPLTFDDSEWFKVETGFKYDIYINMRNKQVVKRGELIFPNIEKYLCYEILTPDLKDSVENITEVRGTNFELDGDRFTGNVIFGWYLNYHLDPTPKVMASPDDEIILPATIMKTNSGGRIIIHQKGRYDDGIDNVVLCPFKVFIDEIANKTTVEVAEMSEDDLKAIIFDYEHRLESGCYSKKSKPV